MGIKNMKERISGIMNLESFKKTARDPSYHY